MNWDYWDVSWSKRFILEKQKTVSSPKRSRSGLVILPPGPLPRSEPTGPERSPDIIMACPLQWAAPSAKQPTAAIQADHQPEWQPLQGVLLPPAGVEAAATLKGQPAPRKGAEPATQSPNVCFFDVLFISRMILVVCCPQIGWFPSTYVDEEGVQ